MTTTLDDIRNFLITSVNAMEPPPQLVDLKHDFSSNHDNPRAPMFTSSFYWYCVLKFCNDWKLPFRVYSYGWITDEHSKMESLDTFSSPYL